MALVALALCVTFTACGDDDEPEVTKPSTGGDDNPEETYSYKLSDLVSVGSWKDLKFDSSDRIVSYTQNSKTVTYSYSSSKITRTDSYGTDTYYLTNGLVTSGKIKEGYTFTVEYSGKKLSSIHYGTSSDSEEEWYEYTYTSGSIQEKRTFRDGNTKHEPFYSSITFERVNLGGYYNYIYPYLKDDKQCIFEFYWIDPFLYAEGYFGTTFDGRLVSKVGEFGDETTYFYTYDSRGYLTKMERITSSGNSYTTSYTWK